MSVQASRKSDLFFIHSEGTCASYLPNHDYVAPSLTKGKVDMDQSMPRSHMPTGKPIEAPNLVSTPPDYSHSIDQLKVTSGYMSMGHITNKVNSPNISQTCARDLGYYKQTDAVFNVLRDNENLVKLSEAKGYGSVRDKLTKADSSQFADTISKRSRFKSN